MAYAKVSLIQDIRHMLQDYPWETTSTTTTTSTTVAVPDGTKWAAGDIGEWAYSGTVGGEQFLVQSIATNNLTVVRGYNGTTAETHTSGDRVTKNARFSSIQIQDAIDRVIDNLFPNMWKEASGSVTPDTTKRWLDSGLTGTDLSGFIDLIRGEQLYGSSSQYVGVYGAGAQSLPRLHVDVQQDLPTALVTSGIGVRFPQGYHHNTNTITMRYRTKVTNTVSGGNYSDLTEGQQTECVALGVCARLLMAKEIPNLSQDQRLGQTKSGDYTQTSAWFDLRFRQVLSSYRAYLMKVSPPAPDQDYLPGWW